MKIHAAPTDIVAFVPDVGDNRERPPEERTVFHIRSMTDAEHADFQAAQIRANAKTKKRDRWKIAEKAIADMEQRILREHVVKIDNLSFEDEDGARPITNGSELAEVIGRWPQAVARALVDSVSEAVLNYDAEDEGFLLASS